MTRRSQTDPVVALSLRRPARPCEQRTEMETIMSDSLGKIGKAARQIRSTIGLIGHLCPPINVTRDQRRNTPKHKSP